MVASLVREAAAGSLLDPRRDAMAEPTLSRLTRREVLGAGGAVATGYCLAAEPVLAQAISTSPADLEVGDRKVKIGGYDMPVYYARPASTLPAPIVLVISEIWGVHEYIRDCTRRFAKEGYFAVAPELFQREGGVSQKTDVQEILKIVLAVPRKQVLGDCAAAIDWAKQQPHVRADRVGVTGWCWGGSTTMQVAGAIPGIRAAVAWYGPPARPYQDTPNPVSGFDVARDIRIPFLGLFGETDQNPKPEDARRFGELLKQNNPGGVEIVVYPGAGHGFHADYRPSYNAAAAKDAWNRCISFFNKHLKA
jgi:carboxymethylenebutenolidase